jgi:hypothetical protein
MQKEFTFAGTMTFEEYLECHTILAAKRRWLFRGFTLIVGAAMIVFSSYDLKRVSFGTFLIVYAVVISPFQFKVRVKRLWDRHPGIRRPVDAKISATGLIFTDDKGNPVHRDWNNLIGFQETDSFFLLFASPRHPLCLPKRLMAGGSPADFRMLLDTTLGQGGGH